MSSQRCGSSSSGTLRPRWRKKRKRSAGSENFHNQRRRIMGRITLNVFSSSFEVAQRCQGPVYLSVHLAIRRSTSSWLSTRPVRTSARHIREAHPLHLLLQVQVILDVLHGSVIRQTLDQFTQLFFGARHRPIPPHMRGSDRAVRHAVRPTGYGCVPPLNHTVSSGE